MMNAMRWASAVVSMICCLSTPGCIAGLTSPLGGSSELLSALKSPATPATDATIVPVANDLSPEQSAQACLRTAHQLDQQHHLPEAIKLYERARGFDPKLSSIARRLAVLYARTSQFDKAQVEFDAALSQTPQDADLNCDAGYCSLQTGDLENAELRLLEALRLQPDHKRATMHLGMLRARQNQPTESLKLFERVVSRAEAHANLGVLLAKQGESQPAIEHLEQARKLNPQLPIPSAFLKQLRNSSAASVQ